MNFVRAFKHLENGKIIKNKKGNFYKKTDNAIFMSKGDDVWKQIKEITISFSDNDWRLVKNVEIVNSKRPQIIAKVLTSTHRLLGYAYRDENNELFVYNTSEIEDKKIALDEDNINWILYQDEIISNQNNYKYITKRVFEYKVSFAEQLSMLD